MYLGRIVESGSAHDVVERAAHPYTRALLAAVPHTDVKKRRLRVLLDGSPPDLGAPPSGCAFSGSSPRT
jgi:oligopeptide/dipeptide ABC transporter ATP-binding protein